MMLVIVSYDVGTRSSEGKRRLRRTAKLCEDYGQRVQCSVFECWLDPVQMIALRAALLETIDLTTDSVRFYFMGQQWHGRVEHYGIRAVPDPDGVLIL